MQIVQLVAAFAMLVILGSAWRHSRVRAQRRWKAAIETFARLQLNRDTPRRILRNFQDWGSSCQQEKLLTGGETAGPRTPTRLSRAAMPTWSAALIAIRRTAIWN